MKYEVINILTTEGYISCKMINATITTDDTEQGLLHIKGKRYSARNFYRHYDKKIKGIFYWRVLFNKTKIKRIVNSYDYRRYYVLDGNSDFSISPTKVFIPHAEKLSDEIFNIPDEYLK